MHALISGQVGEVIAEGITLRSNVTFYNVTFCLSLGSFDASYALQHCRLPVSFLHSSKCRDRLSNFDLERFDFLDLALAPNPSTVVPLEVATSIRNGGYCARVSEVPPSACATRSPTHSNSPSQTHTHSHRASNDAYLDVQSQSVIRTRTHTLSRAYHAADATVVAILRIENWRDARKPGLTRGEKVRSPRRTLSPLTASADGSGAGGGRILHLRNRLRSLLLPELLARQRLARRRHGVAILAAHPARRLQHMYAHCDRIATVTVLTLCHQVRGIYFALLGSGVLANSYVHQMTRAIRLSRASQHLRRRAARRTAHLHLVHCHPDDGTPPPITGTDLIATGSFLARAPRVDLE